MSKIGNFVLELQEQGALLPESPQNDREPDFMEYARDYMKTDEYKLEHDEQTKRSIEGFLDSVRGHGL